MSLALAATFHPRGELGRLVAAYPMLQAAYDFLVFSLPPSATADEIAQIQALPNAQVHVNVDWAAGRYQALKGAFQTGADYIHYADLDRLLRWVELQPAEWRQALRLLPHSDYLLFERSAAAWESHAAALRETERISSAVVSHFLGREVDASAGSRGLSRRAAQFVLANARQEKALGSDAEWLLLCQRGGFHLDFMPVDGLDWEVPDQFQRQAADAVRQQAVRDQYDADAQKWALRVRVAHEIATVALETMRRPLQPAEALRVIEVRRHSMRPAQGVHLSGEGVRLARRVGATTPPYERVITSELPRAFETALAMGYAVDEQLGLLNGMGDAVTDAVAWDGGFHVWAQAYQQARVVRAYCQAQAALLRGLAGQLAEGQAALVVSHGGVVEAQVVGCLPEADFTHWGGMCSYCEGARLYFDGDRCVRGQVLRVK